MKRLLLLVVAGLLMAVGGSNDPYRDPTVGNRPTMVAVSAPGTFTIGSPVSEEYRDGIENELSVTLDYAFRISTTEITNRQYQAMAKRNEHNFGRCDDCPVNQVSYYDATDYLDRLSAKEGLEQCYGNCLAACGGDGASVDFSGCWKPCYDAADPGILSCTGYRLPTAAEFEYVSRNGGTETGSGLVDGDAGVADCTTGGGIGGEAWFCVNSDDSQEPRPYQGYCESLVAGPCVHTQPVATKAANSLGVYDIKGNLYEWTHDYYCNPRSDTANPTGDEGAGCATSQADGTREKRGGSLKEPQKHQRPAQRSSDTPTRRIWNIGFRAVLNGAS